MSDDWESATYEGVERARAVAIARTTPQERYDWLMEALDLAEACGALARARADRQAECDWTWGQPTSGVLRPRRGAG